MQRAMVYAFTEHVDDPALSDFIRKSREKLLTVDVLTVLVIDDAEFLESLRLSGAQELEQLRHIERVCAVVILGIASQPTASSGQGHFRDDAVNSESEPVGAGHVSRDQGFQTFLGSVGDAHVAASSASANSSVSGADSGSMDSAGNWRVAGR